MAACQTEIEANKKLIAELEIVKHDKEAEIKIVEKKTSGLVTAMDHCVLVAIVSVVMLRSGTCVVRYSRCSGRKRNYSSN